MKYPGMRLTIRAAVCMIYIVLIGTVRASDLVSEWTPNLAEVARVEGTLNMPEGSSSLKRYIRYYAGTVLKGHRVLLGHFELSSERPCHKLEIRGSLYSRADKSLSRPDDQNPHLS